MAEKPILFNTEIVRATLEGRKTQTRRVIKTDISNRFDIDTDGKVVACICQATGDSFNPCELSPYKVGDLLWVRETWRETGVITEPYKYKVDDTSYLTGEEGQIISIRYRWKPSIHMPKDAARIWLKVTNVRVERLQEIDAEDCIEEGITLEWSEELPKPSYMSLAYSENAVKPAFVKAFGRLWDTTIKPKDEIKYGWDANPWVWVYEFERLDWFGWNQLN